MGHGHKHVRSVEEQGKWLPYETKIPLGIKIQVIVLIAFVLVLTYFISKSHSGHGHHWKFNNKKFIWQTSINHFLESS